MASVHIDISDEDGLQWEAGGYLHRASSSARLDMPRDVYAAPLESFGCILENAKRGDFTNIERLFDVRLAAMETDPRLAYLATLLLGDAGTSVTYDRMKREMLPDPADYEMVIDYCNALCMRGLLADIPVMLAAYREIIYVRDAEVIATWISDVISSRPDAISEGSSEAQFDDYVRLVMERYHALSDKHGTDQILLLKGERFSPRNLVRLMMERIREPYFDLDLRRRFEAMSGIDCSFGFKDGRLQPLSMAALLEQFLVEAEDNQDLDANVRLFFRHRLCA